MARNYSDRAFWKVAGDSLAISEGADVMNARAQAALHGDHPFPEVGIAQLLRSGAAIDPVTRQMLADALDPPDYSKPPVIELRASSSNPVWKEAKRYWKRREHLATYLAFRASGLTKEEFLDRHKQDTGLRLTMPTMNNVMLWGKIFEAWLAEIDRLAPSVDREDPDFPALTAAFFCEWAARKLPDQRAAEKWDGSF